MCALTKRYCSSDMLLAVRETAAPSDLDAAWRILLEPAFRAGKTFCVATDVSQEDGLEFWAGRNCTSRRVFVAEVKPPQDAASDAMDELVGSYYMEPGRGPGSHVACCAFVTLPEACESVGRAMLLHALQTAASAKLHALQCTFVVAVDELALTVWKGAGFVEVGRLPSAFKHPEQGLVDALVMHRALGGSDLTAWTQHELGAKSKDGSAVVDFGEVFRASAILPAAAKLPAPVLDELGYDAQDWSPAHLVHRFAYHLDTMFAPNLPGIGSPPNASPSKPMKLPELTEVSELESLAPHPVS